MTMLSDPFVPVDPACDVVCDSALAWLRAGVGAVLAAVIELWGRAPRPVGGQLVASGKSQSTGDDWPDAALLAHGLDGRAGVISALRSDRLYIGALGPIRPDAKCALKGTGGSDAQIAHLHAPVGLGLRAQSPAEIVVSILAQVIQVLRRP